ncbi:MAG TPA: outer membrane beta-barrel protein [Pseudolabrys sp.]
MRPGIAYFFAALIGFGAAQAASAADLPLKAPATVTAPYNTAPYNWSGLYVGGNIGYGWGRNSDPDTATSAPAGFLALIPELGGGAPNVQPKGLIGGGQIGYNWMISPNLVAGLVADFQGSGLKDSATNTTPVVMIPGETVSKSNSAQIEWFGTARAKLGWAQNNWLLYATGGLAYGRVETSGSANLGGLLTLSSTGSDSTTKIGWAAGAGLDYGITRNWTIGAEYLYVDLGDTSYTASAPAPLGLSLTTTNHIAAQIARMTVNYKF